MEASVHGRTDAAESMGEAMSVDVMKQAHESRKWQGLTDAEIKAPIQRAMQHFGYDPTQYSLGGAATIGFYGLAKEIEAKLREKNNG